MNQCDKVPQIHALPMIGKGVRISALTGEGIDELLKAIEAALPAGPKRIQSSAAYQAGDLLSRLHEEGQIEKTGIRRGRYPGDAVVPAALQEFCRPYEA